MPVRFDWSSAHDCADTAAIADYRQDLRWWTRKKFARPGSRRGAGRAGREARGRDREGRVSGN